MSLLPAMLAIQARDTRYNGRRFRSRLEARWAVFFDKVGIKYVYEYRDICVNGIRYLPDFWLPDFNCWVEIKPDRPTAEECGKAIRLCVATQQSVFFLVGKDVWPGTYTALEYFPTPSEKWVNLIQSIADSKLGQAIGSNVHWQSPSQAILMSENSAWHSVYLADLRYKFGYRSSLGFFKCAICEKVLLDDHTYEIFKHNHAPSEDIAHRYYVNHPDAPYPPPVLSDLTPAYVAARSARFEYGECP